MIGPHRTRASWRGLAAVVGGLAACTALAAGELAFTAMPEGNFKNGLAVKAGRFGDAVIMYPRPVGQDDKEIDRVGVDAKGNAAVISYKNGGRVRIEGKPDGTVEMTVEEGFPAALKWLRVQGLFGITISETGGAFAVDDRAPVKWPVAKPENGHLFQGQGRRLVVTDGTGDALDMAFPPHTYIQISDNRAWNWPVYNWKANLVYNPAQRVYSFAFKPGKAEGGDVDPKDLLIVDRFGQDYKMDFPGKVKSEEELKADIAADDAYYAGFHKPAAWDQWGGLPVGKELGLKATGFFRVEKVKYNGVERWMFVNPDGNPWWQTGICSYTPNNSYGLTRNTHNLMGPPPGALEWLPDPNDPTFASAWHDSAQCRNTCISFYAANWIRKFGKPFSWNEWTAVATDRLQRFGFNASGAFAGITQEMRDRHFAYSPSLPLGVNNWDPLRGCGIPGMDKIFDPFNEETVAKVDAVFAQFLPKFADDPYVIGYFLENEQPFENVPTVIPNLKGTSASKRRLVRFLEEKYGDIAKFNAAWGQDAADFAALADLALPVKTPDSAKDMQVFTEMFLDQYYRVVREAFDKYDKNHLLLGNRWMPRAANHETLVRVAAKYLDVLSLNYYTNVFDRAMLARFFRVAGDKPWLFSEWDLVSHEDTGLPGGSSVGSQAARGDGYRQYVEQAAAMPQVVGSQWFLPLDQSRLGRHFQGFSGEKGNTGFFSVADRPYKPLLEAAAKANYAVYDIAFGKQAPFQSAMPIFAAKGGAVKRTYAAMRATNPIPLDGNRNAWPAVPDEWIREDQLVIGPDGGGMSGAFRVTWDDRHLHFMIDVMDPTPMENAQREPRRLWNGDAVELFLGADQFAQPGRMIFGDRHILLGAREGAPTFVGNMPEGGGNVEAFIQRKVDGAGYTLQARIPWTDLGVAPKPGMELLFDVALDDSVGGEGRVRQFDWNGSETASSDRGVWGRLRLGE